MSKYTIGLDFGTNSCRSLIVDIITGREVAGHVFEYPSGQAGVVSDPRNPNLARQNPADYLQGIEVTVREALREARREEPDFSPENIIGIGVDTTGSSPMPVDREGQPLCFRKEFRNNPAAMVWLWKDHTAHEEAARITEAAVRLRPEYPAKIGGVYSSEWFWSKLLHLETEDPAVFAATWSFVEICDWIPGILTGDVRPAHLKRSVCAAGHKAMYSREWGGLPDTAFLKELSPRLAAIREQLYSDAFSSEVPAGFLSPEWAEKLGLSTDVSVAVGALDAHMAAVGAGVGTDTLVKILGTSTCDIMVRPNDKPLADIPGVCGIVDGSVMGGYYGIEAGQSAVGDIFLWFVNHLTPEKYGRTPAEKFANLEREAARLLPGESGLLALDWHNGNRTVLVDVRLSGLVVGQTLHTEPHEIYRALLEATAFGALVIIDRIAENGVSIKDIINCGGLAVKNPLLLQIYADITGRPMKVSRSEQAAALGAAIFGAVAAGKERSGFADVRQAQQAMTGIDQVFRPNREHHAVYRELYRLYRQMHDAFGTKDGSGMLYNVMKDLLDLRDRVRQGR